MFQDLEVTQEEVVCGVSLMSMCTAASSNLLGTTGGGEILSDDKVLICLQ